MQENCTPRFEHFSVILAQFIHHSLPLISWCYVLLDKQHVSCDVLFGLGNCNKVSQTGVPINNKYFWKFWSLEVQDQGASVFGWGVSSGLLCPHVVQWVTQVSEVSFIRALVLFMIPPSWHWGLPRVSPPPPNSITLELGFQHTNFGETQTFRP